jgi:hypothetical protein
MASAKKKWTVMSKAILLDDNAGLPRQSRNEERAGGCQDLKSYIDLTRG